MIFPSNVISERFLIVLYCEWMHTENNFFHGVPLCQDNFENKSRIKNCCRLIPDGTLNFINNQGILIARFLFDSLNVIARY